MASMPIRKHCHSDNLVRSVGVQNRYEREIHIASTAVSKAIAIANSRFQSTLALSFKDANSDVVTDVDIACEAEIVKIINQAFPGHAIIVEEACGHDVDSLWKWIVDPLDGTNNYAYALPTFGVSLVLCYDNQPVVACLAEGFRAPLVIAVANEGVTIGTESWVSPRQIGSRPSAALWVGYQVDRSGEECLGLISILSRLTRRTFENWAPVIDVGLYLRGALEVIVGLGCNGTELPAVLLVLKEAGARIVGVNGTEVDLANPPHIFIAGRSDVVDIVLPEIRIALKERFGRSPTPTSFT